MKKIAVLDDWQRAAKNSTDWSTLERRADVHFFIDPFASEDAAAVNGRVMSRQIPQAARFNGFGRPTA